MKYFDINDLSLIAKIRSDLLYVISQIESDDHYCENDEAAHDLKRVVVDLFDFEKGIHEEFFSKDSNQDS